MTGLGRLFEEKEGSQEQERESTHSPERAPASKFVVPIVAAVAIAAAGLVYALHEHSSARSLATQNAQMATQNAQMTNQLSATQSEVQALASKVNTLQTSETQASETQPSPSGARSASAATPSRRAGAPGTRRANAAAPRFDPRFNKLQAQLDEQGKALDAQGKQIDATRSDLASTQTDLQSARTELGGSIAKTHGELVLLEKRGQSSYFEFDISKAKQFKHAGPVGISLRKANDKRQYADLMLMVDDRNLQQKHVNLYQPAMFYAPDNAQPISIVINQISKDHIHGYVSAPKYRKSELDAMANSNSADGQQTANSGQGDNDIVNPNQTANANAGPTLKHRSPQPPSDAAEE
jgi:hypothetical protein